MTRNIPSQFWVAPVGVLLALLGLIGPWAKVTSIFSASVSGLDTDDGKLVGLLVLLALGFRALYVFEKQRQASLAAAGLLGVVITMTCGYDLVRATRVVAGIESEYATVSVGWGLYACVLGGLGIAGGVWFTFAETRKQNRASLAERIFPRQHS